MDLFARANHYWPPPPNQEKYSFESNQEVLFSVHSSRVRFRDKRIDLICAGTRPSRIGRFKSTDEPTGITSPETSNFFCRFTPDQPPHPARAGHPDPQVDRPERTRKENCIVQLHRGRGLDHRITLDLFRLRDLYDTEGDLFAPRHPVPLRIVRTEPLRLLGLRVGGVS